MTENTFGWSEERWSVERARSDVREPRWCSVCGHEASIWMPAHPGLAWCGYHEPDAGWSVEDGFGVLRDGSMAVKGDR